MKLKGSVNYLSVLLLLFVINCVQVSLQLPDLSSDKVSDLKVESDSKVSGYQKNHGSHKEADSNGWKNLKSSSKGKLDKGKQDEEMFLGEGKHKAKKVNGFHSESGGHKSKDKGLNKKWNRGDGLMKTWNWNKGGHSEEEEGGKWKTTLHHSDKSGKKMGHSKEKASDAGGSHLESSKKKLGSREGSKKKMEKHDKKEKQSKKWNNDSGKSSSSMEKKMDQMKFDKYEKPMRSGGGGGWGYDQHDSTFKGKYSHPLGYKGVDHSSIHGGRLSSSHEHHHAKEKVMSKNKGKKDKFDSLDGELDDSIDKNLPDELKSLKDMEGEMMD